MLRSPFAVGRIFLNPVFIQHEIEPGGIRLAEQRTVQVKHRDAVRLRNIIRAVFVRHGFDIIDQGLLRSGAVHPEGELLCL